MSLLPRFFPSSNAGGPIVVDRDRALAAGFLLDATAREVARLLNQQPAMVTEFEWFPKEEGDARG